MKARASIIPLEIVEGAEDEGIDDSDAGGVEQKADEIIESSEDQ
jgi:hypothetical protein